jgi:hypothetical protein
MPERAVKIAIWLCCHEEIVPLALRLGMAPILLNLMLESHSTLIEVGALKRHWETMTVGLTVGTAILALVGLGFSFWEDRRPFFKRIDRVFSIASVLASVLAGLALIRFTNVNRIAEAESDQHLTDATRDATKALRDLDDEKLRLVNTQKELETVSSTAEGQLGQLRKALDEADARSMGWAHLQELIVRMQSDDATAFDELRNKEHFTSPNEESLVKQAVEQIIDTHNLPGYKGGAGRSFHMGFTPRELVNMLDQHNETWVKYNALSMLMDSPVQWEAGSKLTNLALHDRSLDVRTMAVQLINHWVGNRFRALIPEKNIADWDKHNPAAVSR